MNVFAPKTACLLQQVASRVPQLAGTRTSLKPVLGAVLSDIVRMCAVCPRVSGAFDRAKRRSGRFECGDSWRWLDVGGFEDLALGGGRLCSLRDGASWSLQRDQVQAL